MVPAGHHEVLLGLRAGCGGVSAVHGGQTERTARLVQSLVAGLVGDVKVGVGVEVLAEVAQRGDAVTGTSFSQPGQMVDE